MLPTFISRTPFKYNIKSLDELLRIDGMTGVSADCSYLLYDEQILRILIAGGIDGAKAYATIKHIKKKHQDKVLEVKAEFKSGFTKYLKEKENATEAQASEVVEKIWKIIEDSSSYLFCSAHSYAMACDSAYCAYLKAHYPYEFYATALKLYTEKGKKDKIAALIDEMRRYAGIHLSPGRFGEDNRGWSSNKEEKTISQSLSSIKYISSSAAEALYEASLKTFDSFSSVLWHLLNDSRINSRQIEVLIKIGYFQDFGRSLKLMTVFNEFKNGKNRVTKSLKSWQTRLEALKKFENEIKDEALPVEDTVRAENEYIGLCFSCEPSAKNEYMFTEIDDKYSVRVKLYNIFRGRYTSVLRMKKDTYALKQPKIGDIIRITDRTCYAERPKRIYKDGISVQSDEKETWLLSYALISRAAPEGEAA